MLLKKIIVAEDDDSIAHMVNMALGDAGYLCMRARDGLEALSLVRMHSPDLLILDVMMPSITGHEVARKLKGDVILSRTPILMLTSLDGVDDKVKGFESGADDYLVKPFDLRQLSARAAALIRASRRERERNPTTELPGSTAIEEHVESVLRSDRDAIVIQIDVRGFERYADVVGHTRAHALVASLGNLILDRMRAVAGDGGFVGHLGGVDFVVVVEPEVAEPLAQAVIEAFEEQRPELEAPVDPSLSRRKSDQLALAVAIVPTSGIAAGGGDEMAARMAQVMRSCKQREGSSYVVWDPSS
jgi:DNA-binding response OmpR family regulator